MTGSNHLNNWTCVGIVIGAHGVAGGLKIRSFCAIPSAIKNYNPLKIEDYPEALHFRLISQSHDIFQVRLEAIKDRKSAHALKGKLLFAERNKLPVIDKEEYYYADLIGLQVKDQNDDPIAKITNVNNYGAGTVIEITHNKSSKTIMLPFNIETIPVVNLDKKYISLKTVPQEFLKAQNH